MFAKDKYELFEKLLEKKGKDLKISELHLILVLSGDSDVITIMQEIQKTKID